MKIYQKITVLTLGLSSLIACQDLDKLNQDPNKVKSASPHLLLTPISKNAFSLDGISKEYASRMLISTDGENTYQYYKWNRADYDDFHQLLQVDKMMQQAIDYNQPQYIAVGHFLKAYYFYQLTMKFGDIPFSQALQGETAIKFPTYDTQAQVMEGILKELDLAQSLIQQNATLQGDIIYGGDLDKWKRLINSYQLKVLMSLSKKTSLDGYSIAQRFAQIYANAPLLRNNQDSGELHYFDQGGSRYPQFNQSSYASGMYMSGTFIDLLVELKDPRLFVFAQPTASALEQGLALNDFSAYNGGNPTVAYWENEELVGQKNISKVNSRYYQDPVNEPTSILSYSELQFILAEASLRGWISGDASSFYNQGIKANFEFYATYAQQQSSYLSSEALQEYLNQSQLSLDVGNFSLGLKQILTQKYITMFHQGNWSIYYDHLRTGYPHFQTQDNVTPGLRWIYPLSEYNTNSVNLQIAIDRQFDGVDNIHSQPWWLQ